VLKRGARIEVLAPFLDARPFAAAAAARTRHRRALARRLPKGARDGRPLLLAVGMMRSGDKLDSYRVLARALRRIARRPWQLAVVGDGVARDAVERAFAPLGDRVTYLGALEARSLPPVYAAADLYVWPAVREAYGMAILEAAAAGLPAVAGRGVGVADLVEDGRTGLLVGSDDDAGLARSIAALLDDPARRQAMSRAALERVAARHDIASASTSLDKVMCDAVRRRPARRSAA
jgi:glycosyltransferase involved in cell wall biosynthesis